MGLLIAGLVLWLTADEPVTGGVLFRAGAVLGAIWLVLPTARSVPRSVWMGIAAPVTALIARPQLILWGLAAGVVIVILAGLGARAARLPQREPPR